MSDLDGDSTMHSSPSLDDADDDEMFPDEALPNNPHTPHNPSLNLGAAELSPPDSQTRDPATLTPGVNANGKRPLSLAQTTANVPGGSGVHRDTETGYTWSRQEDQPGFEWKNIRAREDEVRALDNIVDKGSQIKTRYGDPLDASVPAKNKR